MKPEEVSIFPVGGKNDAFAKYFAGQLRHRERDFGAGIGAFIYEFVPTDLLANFAGVSNLWAVPLAAIVGIPMYIRTETMIPIASILISKGVAPGVMIALILGGAGASIPEVSLLSSIFKKKMVIAFVLCIFAVAVITGYVFNFIL